MSRTVAIDDEALSMHVPRKLATTFDMELVSIETARERGAVPCSQCFPRQDSVVYDFPYMDA